MTRDETIEILMVVQAAYPNYKPHDKTVTVNLWYEMLLDYSYQQVGAAVKAYIRTDKRGFAPSIGDIVDKLQMLFGDEQIDEVQAWGIVWKAICNSGSHADEEFENLPELIKKVVGSPGQLRQWALSLQSTSLLRGKTANFTKKHLSSFYVLVYFHHTISYYFYSRYEFRCHLFIISSF